MHIDGLIIWLTGSVSGIFFVLAGIHCSDNKPLGWRYFYGGVILVAITGVLLFVNYLWQVKTEVKPQYNNSKNYSYGHYSISHKVAPNKFPIKILKQQNKAIQPPLTSQHKYQPTINSPNSAISVNQQGGITAYNYINKVPPPRRLTDKQMNEYIHYLRNIPQKLHVQIWYNASDPESMDFAYQISSALTKSGWQTHIGGQLSNLPIKGVALVVKNINAIPESAIAMAQGLKNLGQDIFLATDMQSDGNYLVELHVGTKP